jgi:nitric oxide reductase NorQ protein
VERLGLTLNAPKEFCLVVSYNPGYQSILKDLKDSTRQRMVAIEFGFPAPDIEEKIIACEASIGHDTAAQLVRFGRAIRRLETAGLREVASTRVLIAAGRLIAEGLDPREAARAAIAGPLTDDTVVTKGLAEMIDVYLADQQDDRRD